MTPSLRTELLSDLLTRALKKDRNYARALEVARTFGQGEITLLGGAVYRTLARELYGVWSGEHDYDFLVGRCSGLAPTTTHNILTSYWGNPRFVPSVMSQPKVDLIQLNQTGLSRAQFIDEATFTIQAIGYDACEGRVLGDIGIRALSDRTVALNNPRRPDTMEWSSAMLRKRLHEKAGSLGFDVQESLTSKIFSRLASSDVGAVKDSSAGLYTF